MRDTQELTQPRSYRSLKLRSTGLRHLRPPHTTGTDHGTDTLVTSWIQNPHLLRLEWSLNGTFPCSCGFSWPPTVSATERHSDSVIHLALASLRGLVQHLGKDWVVREKLLVCFTEDSSLPSSYPGLDCLPAGLSLPGCCLYLPPAWQPWLYLNIDESHFLCIPMFYPCGVDSGKPLRSWAPNAPCVPLRTISGALKENWTFWQLEWCSDRGRGKKKREKLRYQGIFLWLTKWSKYPNFPSSSLITWVSRMF